MKMIKLPKRRSPVAKNLNRFNRPSVERDRTKYTRKVKHKGAANA